MAVVNYSINVSEIYDFINGIYQRMTATAWWTPFLNQPNSVNRLNRQKLEDLYARSLDHLRQLSDQEATMYNSMRDMSARSTKNLSVPPSPTSQSTLYVTADRRVNQLIKTINSLNADRTQLQEEINVLQDMLMKLNANINKDKFTPADLLYSYTFENQQMKSICSGIVDLNSSTNDETDHEDYLFILDLFSESALKLLPRRLEKTQPAYDQRMADLEDDIASLSSERALSKKKVQDLNDHINNIPRPTEGEVTGADLNSLLTKIQALGDTKTRLENAQRELDLMKEQKRINDAERAAEGEAGESDFTSPMVGTFVDTPSVAEMRQRLQEKVMARSELQDRRDSLSGRVQIARQAIEAAERDARRPQQLSVSPSTAYLSGEFSRRLSSADVTPENLQMVWNWSQQTRLDDLIADVSALTKHRQLLENRRDTLQRKTEQLDALCQNYADHIEKLNAVIQESQRADNE